jgi:hypothetical protein
MASAASEILSMPGSPRERKRFVGAANKPDQRSSPMRSPGEGYRWDRGYSEGKPAFDEVPGGVTGWNRSRSRYTGALVPPVGPTLTGLNPFEYHLYRL